MLDDHRPRNTTTGVAHQVLEQGEFLGSQVDGPASPRNPPFDPIQLEVLDLEH
jgi:hypothetical protein